MRGMLKVSSLSKKGIRLSAAARCSPEAMLAMRWGQIVDRCNWYTTLVVLMVGARWDGGYQNLLERYKKIFMSFTPPQRKYLKFQLRKGDIGIFQIENKKKIPGHFDSLNAPYPLPPPSGILKIVLDNKIQWLTQIAMVRAWGCAWKRLMTCLILSRSFSCHKYTYEEKSTLLPYLQSETQMDRQRRVPGPFVPQMNLCRKCISVHLDFIKEKDFLFE